MDIELTKSGGVLLKSRLHLQDDLVLVRWSIDRRDLLSAIGIVEGTLDLQSRDSQSSCLITINLNIKLGIIGLNVAGYVQQSRHGCNPSFQCPGVAIEFVAIRALKRQLVRTFCDLTTYLDQGRSLQIDPDSGHRRKLRAQVFDNCVHALMTLRQWL